MTRTEMFKLSPITHAYITNPLEVAAIRDTEQTPDHSIFRIKGMVAGYFNVSVESLAIKSRRREYVLPRQIAMTLLKVNTRLSFKAIGRLFGDRDHTTVIHSMHTIDNLMETDAMIRNDVNFLQSKI